MPDNAHHEPREWNALIELKRQVQSLKAQVELLEEVQKSLIKQARRLEDERKRLEKP